jgi:hypothetical protein
VRANFDARDLDASLSHYARKLRSARTASHGDPSDSSIAWPVCLSRLLHENLSRDVLPGYHATHVKIYLFQPFQLLFYTKDTLADDHAAAGSSSLPLDQTGTLAIKGRRLVSSVNSDSIF